MEKPSKYYEKDNDLERDVSAWMEEFDIDETNLMLEDIEIKDISLHKEYLDDIKRRVSDKTGVPIFGGDRTNKGFRMTWKKYIAAAAVVLFALIAWKNSNTIVYAFQSMFGLIPGVGIVEGNEDIVYLLKEPKKVETEEGIFSLINAVATKTNIRISFSFERKGITEEKILEEKRKAAEELFQTDKTRKPEIYLIVNGVRFDMSWGSTAGGGTIEFVSANMELEEELINTDISYQIIYGDYDIGTDFTLTELKQYDSLQEIGPTQTYNNISLTATAEREGNKLKVNVYPINSTKYRLLSFDSEYDLNYFGKKIKLDTELGEKDYTLPGSYGSGMNAAYTFDISDGSKNHQLLIPGVLVESDETQKVTLPLPKDEETITVNKEVKFKDGIVIIESVKKVVKESANEFGELKINLKYISNQENQQLVAVKFTRSRSEGWSEEYDKEGRLSAINYMLEDKEKDNIKFSVVNPKYIFMDEYKLKLNK